MDKEVESHIIDYIYERMVQLMMPIVKMPMTFSAFAAPLLKPGLFVTSIITFDRIEFERMIHLLVAYERYSKKVTSIVSMPLAKRRYSDIIKGKEGQSILCKNNYRLCEFYNLMNAVDDEYIAYLRVNALMSRAVDGFNEKERNIEFSVGLAGFDIIDKDGKAVSAGALTEVWKKWEIICAERNYYSDFSTLIGRATGNAIIFWMDYTAKPYGG